LPRSADVVAASADRSGRIRGRSLVSPTSTPSATNMRECISICDDSKGFGSIYITTCVHDRKAVLAQDEPAGILVEEWRGAHRRHGWAIGRYVVMPDHIHFFCRAEIGAKTCPTLSVIGRAGPAVPSKRRACRGYNAAATRVLRSRSGFERKLFRKVELRSGKSC
jgi:hypothetical protein